MQPNLEALAQHYRDEASDALERLLEARIHDNEAQALRALAQFTEFYSHVHDLEWGGTA